VFWETNSLEAVAMSLERELRATFAPPPPGLLPLEPLEEKTRFRNPLNDSGPVWRDF